MSAPYNFHCFTHCMSPSFLTLSFLLFKFSFLFNKIKFLFVKLFLFLCFLFDLFVFYRLFDYILKFATKHSILFPFFFFLLLLIFPLCSSSTVSAPITRVGDFALCASVNLFFTLLTCSFLHVSFLGVGERRLRDGQSRL